MHLSTMPFMNTVTKTGQTICKVFTVKSPCEQECLLTQLYASTFLNSSCQTEGKKSVFDSLCFLLTCIVQKNIEKILNRNILLNSEACC